MKRLADSAAECLPEEEGRALKNGVKRRARESLTVVGLQERRVTPAPAERWGEGDEIEITENGFRAIAELDQTLRDIEAPTQVIVADLVASGGDG